MEWTTPAAIVLAALCVALVVLLCARRSERRLQETQRALQSVMMALSSLGGTFATQGDAVERSLRAQEERAERLRVQLETRLTGMAGQLTGQQHLIETRVDAMQKDNAHKLEAMLLRLDAQQQSLERRVEGMGKDSADRFTAMAGQLDVQRQSLDTRVEAMRKDNADKLEAMRQTVDEKLQKTLDERLNQSFAQVSQRLEQVYKGLGEMQTLAAGVGDLKRVLTNVKTRGTWGEIQLGNLLEQMLSSGQYDKNVAVKRGSQERVDFAVRMPGADEEGVLLPIDAKFPQENYARLMEAYDAVDAQAVQRYGKALAEDVKAQARSIRDKYISPPATTDFAVLYLPAEGLYAEVLRQAGLVEQLQADYRVTVSGPTTLSALLTSLQMGFRTVAIQKRTTEVWKLLGAVKADFGRFAQTLEKTQRALTTATNSIDDAAKRTRMIERRLRSVEEMPESQARELLGEGEGEGEESDDGLAG